ncbi:hypothetical protein ACOMCU_22600 [Lysinibacillus sp. UGB7]|uniref:hypothetical protein n=1 Tax=Lysinibacillus sp. UGB7 TaxID=3411039 RepID=UPI003B7CA49E
MNNYNTLDHHEGMVWISKLFKTENRGNICVLLNGEFQVLAYVSPDMLETRDLDTVVADIVAANGTSYKLQTNLITCSICGITYDETLVNIVDYPDDVCKHCEKNYLDEQ